MTNPLDFPILSLLIFLPLGGAVILLFIPGRHKELLRATAFGAALLNFFASLILFTTFITIIAVLCSWSAVEERVKEYMIYMLALSTGMIGVFVCLDMILFFLFWEIGLVPMYFLIGIWGGPRKLYANIKNSIISRHTK